MLTDLSLTQSMKSEKDSCQHFCTLHSFIICEYSQHKFAKLSFAKNIETLILSGKNDTFALFWTILNLSCCDDGSLRVLYINYTSQQISVSMTFCFHRGYFSLQSLQLLAGFSSLIRKQLDMLTDFSKQYIFALSTFKEARANIDL